MRVIDVNTPGAHSDEFGDWLREHKVEPDLTFKVEITDSGKTMVVHQYDTRAENGKQVKYVMNRGAGDVAVKEPFEVWLESPVPDVVK